MRTGGATAVAGLHRRGPMCSDACPRAGSSLPPGQPRAAPGPTAGPRVRWRKTRCAPRRHVTPRRPRFSSAVSSASLCRAACARAAARWLFRMAFRMAFAASARERCPPPLCENGVREGDGAEKRRGRRRHEGAAALRWRRAARARPRGRRCGSDGAIAIAPASRPAGHSRARRIYRSPAHTAPPTSTSLIVFRSSVIAALCARSQPPA